MNLRDAFEVFCARSAPAFRGITQPTNGMMCYDRCKKAKKGLKIEIPLSLVR